MSAVEETLDPRRLVAMAAVARAAVEEMEEAAVSAATAAMLEWLDPRRLVAVAAVARAAVEETAEADRFPQ